MDPVQLYFEIIKCRSQLSDADLTQLIELDTHYFPTPWSMTLWENLKFEPDNLLIILKLGEAIVAFSLLGINRSDNFGHLLKILVHPEHRGKGLAMFLLSKTLNALKEIDIHKVYLEVEQANQTALKLYEKLGFNIIHSKKDFYGSNRSAFIMTNFNQ